MKRPARLRTALVATGVGATLAATAWQVLGDPAASAPATGAARAPAAAASATARPLPTRPAPAPAAPSAASPTAAPATASRAAPAGGSDLLLGGSPAAPATGAEPPARRPALAALDTRVVQQRVGPADASRDARDAFATRSWTIAPPPPPPPPPEPPPPPPPPPEAPPLPFKYMGKLDESASRTLWYLLQGERLVVAATGEVIDATYRIDGPEAGQLRFTYLPLQKRQSLAIGGSP